MTNKFSTAMQEILLPLLSCMITCAVWGLVSILAQIPSNPECTYELDMCCFGNCSAFAIIFYLVVYIVVDRKILDSDFPYVSPFISLMLNILLIIGSNEALNSAFLSVSPFIRLNGLLLEIGNVSPGWLSAPIAYQTCLSLILYFASCKVCNDYIDIPASYIFVHFAYGASFLLFLTFVPILGPMGAEMIISLILGLMLGIIGFYIYTRREDASLAKTISRVVSDSIPRPSRTEEHYQTQYGEVYASPSYGSDGYYESYHEDESTIPELPPEEEMPSSFRLPTQPPSFVRLRGPVRGQSHAHGQKEKKKTIVRPGVVKLQEVTREKKCIACKTTENVTHVCAAKDCGKYYCNDCASDIKQTCLDCGQPLKRMRRRLVEFGTRKK